jgi:hypothetical protein
MHSPVVPLLWEILRQGRTSLVALAGATGLSWLIDYAERGNPPGPFPAMHNEVLGLLSFVILIEMFSFVESSGGRGMSRFPRRHFTLPISTLQLVAVPAVAGIVGIELLYLVWKGRLSDAAPAHQLFVAVLLGAFMIFYQASMWTLERVGPLRLIFLGAISIAFFWIGSLPSMGEREASWWRTRPVLGGVVAALAVVQFFLVRRAIGRLRSGGPDGGSRIGVMMGRLSDAIPRRRTGFRSARTAYFWFEWRCSGTGFPLLVAGALVFLLGPVTLTTGNDPGTTTRILVGALALPLVLAIPAGMGLSKPLFWSEKMSLPSFVAVLPLSDAELIAIRIKVAAVATVIAWLLVFGFLAAWLSLWGDGASVGRLLAELRAADERWWPGILALVVGSAMFVSWRFSVAGLWAGMSGQRAWFMASLAPIGVLIVAGAVFDIGALPGWIGADLSRLTPFLWAGVLAVVVKLWLAARGFRRTTRRWPIWYVVTWLAGVGCLIGLGAVVMSYAGRDLSDSNTNRLWAAFILLAVLLMPIARVAWAPWFLGRNRHQQ